MQWVTEMEENGFPIYAITMQNEPLNKGNSMSLYMPWEDQLAFVKKLGPAFRKAGIDTKILCYDHNYNYDNVAGQQNYPLNIYADADAAQWVDGSAWHNYGGSVSELDNIRAARPEATREEVEAAAHAAQCDDIIAKFPEGLATRVGADGVYLSGGECQRIALARAILKDAPVVVLDEATAFADPENEALIQQALGRLAAGKTVLMIAHRLSTVVDADLIAVVDDGAIVERGTHDELLARGGTYARLWKNYCQAAQWKIAGGSAHAA